MIDTVQAQLQWKTMFLHELHSPSVHCSLLHIHLFRFCNHSIWRWRHTVWRFSGETAESPVQGNTAVVSYDNWHCTVANVDAACSL